MLLPSVPTAAIYCRISHDVEGRRLGVDRQEHSCRRLALQRGFTEVRVFVDNDISAFSGELRPAYQQMLELMSAGAFEAVIAWDGDRLHRSTRELEDFIDVVEATCTPVLTVTSGEVDFATATGRMQARMKGNISRYESEHKTERTAAAHAWLAQAGRWKGGPRPYGFDVDRDNHGRPLGDGRLIVVEHEAAVVREAAARVLAGESVYAICADLNARSIPTTKSGRWRTQTLRRILTNPTTVGKREYHGEIVADALWPGLLSEPDWHQLRDRLQRHSPDNRHGPRPPTRRRRWLLTGGIAVCGRCGNNLHAHVRDSGARAYNCMSGPDKEGCGGVTCSALALDQHVIHAVLAHYQRPDTQPSNPGTLREQGIAELAQQFADGRLSGAAWQIVQAGITATEALMIAPTDLAPSPDQRVVEQWLALPTSRQRERISLVLERVIVSPTRHRGPSFDHNRLELVWHTETASTPA